MTPMTEPQSAPDPGEPTQAWQRPDWLLPDAQLPAVPPRYIADALPVVSASIADPEPFPEPPPAPPFEAASAPEPPVNDFPADFRELPLFRLTAKIRGWCGFPTRHLRRPQPQPAPEPPVVLQPVGPAVFLRAFTPDGHEADQMVLSGAPEFVAIATDAVGRRFAGISLGCTAQGTIGIDTASVHYLDYLIDELRTARDELAYGEGLSAAATLAGGAR